MLFIHSGTGLYGSDRMLLLCIAAARGIRPSPNLEVWLTAEGDLSRQIREDYPEVEIRFENIAILRRYDLRRLDFSALFRAINFSRWLKRFEAYDLVLVNTVVVLDAMLALRFAKTKGMVYVHETITGLSRIFFRFLLQFSQAQKIFVSAATQKALGIQGHAKERVIWNGCKSIILPVSTETRHKGAIHILQIGRISVLKGQALLLEALALLPEDIRNQIRLRIVGDVFGEQAALLEGLKKFAEEKELAHIVQWIPFTKDPAGHYAWSDIVLIPSVFPESFPLVALEAMSAGRPVIAAAHGGLKEIVVDQVTGWLFPPRDAVALSTLLSRVVCVRDAWSTFGAAGRALYEAHFSEERCMEEVKAVLSGK